jgi:hypothetical protein
MLPATVGPHKKPQRARANYDELLAFTRAVAAMCNPAHAVRVTEQPDMGLGLQAARDIMEGELVVWYGGPYVPTRSIPEKTRTHAVQIFDPNGGPDQVSRAIDGKMVSVAFQDPQVTDAERAELTLIAGAMTNSSIHDDEAESMLRWAPPTRLLRWTSPRGVAFAAKPFVATRFTPKGTGLLWRYHYFYHDETDPLSFLDVLPPAAGPPTTKPKKRIAPMANPPEGGKVPKLGVDVNGLASLARLKL